ncbi:hypothetical protein IJG72_05715 [bacterium]|nr:hypothetical protein [bacterium]
MTKKETINIPEIGIAEIFDYIPTAEEEQKIFNFEKQAEEDINKKKQTANVNFRWSEFEIARAKKIAEKIGLPYQTYLKMTLKQAMDADEKKFM